MLSEEVDAFYVMKCGLYTSYSGNWDYGCFDRRRIPFFNPKGWNNSREIGLCLRDLARKHRFGVFGSDKTWEPVNYSFRFTIVVFDSDRIIRNALKRGRTVY